ncbi:MAG: GAF domain-containing protein, partial [Cyclobacteriaceae bacterium]
RFEEEADKFMQRQMRNEQPVFSDIVFKNVYPLYGQLDIKGSSEKRNKAVKADLTKQLTEVSKVLAVASEHTKMVIYEQLSFRVESYRKDLKSELLSGSEHRIINFLETEIHPVFLDLSKQSVELKKSTEAYLELLHQDMHSVYEQRKKYDHSVNIINQTLASFLDEKQVEAQQMFPHYFERYKTDGVEYNIYVGQSISKNMEFTSIYLQNLQLWQLLVTCEMEKKFAEVKDALDTDIEIASLILVYNTPLAVHFRMDEKRFDVEGAYNARYEIVKKRIDKAHVKNTSERITSPGKIAIIYSSEQDAITYGRYLSFLESKGYLKKGSRETLEVENLQGISGL